jgi:hypothetical protein
MSTKGAATRSSVDSQSKGLRPNQRAFKRSEIRFARTKRLGARHSALSESYDREDLYPPYRAQQWRAAIALIGIATPVKDNSGNVNMTSA